MFTKHQGTTVVEWLVILCLVVVVGGVIAYTIATNASTQGGHTGNWINSLSVPDAHP
jgi:hypothetical protein